MDHESFILCWSASWLGSDKILSGRLTPAEAVGQEDIRIVEDLADLIREADVLVAHNIDGFDLPRLNSRLLLNGLEPIGPKRTIDTLKLARKHLALAYNKLDYLAEKLFGDHKLKTDFQLWKDCYYGNEKALAKMLRYNRKDVVLLKAVYDFLLPYVQGTPKLATPEYDGQHACPHCGALGDKLTKRGFYHTNVSSFQQYHCSNCGKYSRDRKAVKARFDVAPL
jgi:uncharacterized protein YprB with RNaseH-like and TPR domain